MPIRAQKQISHGAPISGLVRADFKGGDSFELHGYWMHPTRRANIEVPIFQHAFYPTLDQTDLDIKQNIDYRNVIVPSISDLRQAGIEVDKAIFVAEVYTHPRYIKHNTFFRTEFPASVKSLARQSGIVFVFPANDNPFARLKRKQVLNFYRASFTPLMIKGKHYTSGRMNFFFVAPAHATTALKKSLNLEHLEESSWNEATHPLLMTQQRSHARFKSYEKELSDTLRQEIRETVYPLVTAKFDIDQHSAEGARLQRMMDDPRFAQELINATAHKPKSRRFEAVKRWVNQIFWPKLKYIISTETGDALEQGARYAVRLALSVAFDQALGKLQTLPDPENTAKRVPKWYGSVRRGANQFNFNIHDSGPFALGSIGYSSNRPMLSQDANRWGHDFKLKAIGFLKDVPSLGEAVESAEMEMLNILKVVITTSKQVIISVDDNHVERLRRDQRVALGDLTPVHIMRIKQYLPNLSQHFTNELAVQQGMF